MIINQLHLLSIPSSIPSRCKSRNKSVSTKFTRRLNLAAPAFHGFARIYHLVHFFYSLSAPHAPCTMHHAHHAHHVHLPPAQVIPSLHGFAKIILVDPHHSTKILVFKVLMILSFFALQANLMKIRSFKIGPVCVCICISVFLYLCEFVFVFPSPPFVCWLVFVPAAVLSPITV